MQIGRRLLEVISAVLKDAEKKRADIALREALRSAELFPAERTQVTHLVFSFYRWRGWLDLKKPLRSQLELINELVESFSRNPERFSDHDLIARALPAWAREMMPISGALVREFQHEPRLWLRARPGKGVEVAAKLKNSFSHETVPDAIWYQGPEDLFRTSLFHEGQFEMQDLSSQIVGHICAPLPGQTWWDVCAGEGGKTLHLCDLMQNKGTVWASDPAEWRLKNLKRRAGRAKLFNYRLAPWTHQQHLPTKTKFDGILVDAPCSGTGTWGRNPHARWSTTEQDVRELAEIQKGILEKIAGSVKPAGKLVYAVCTLTKPETQEVVDDFSSKHPEYERAEIMNPAKKNEKCTTLQLLPHDVLANGMFVAEWRRK
jgi:16S rRNA (cytosine967-C5)-methyltransferase